MQDIMYHKDIVEKFIMGKGKNFQGLENPQVRVQ
jgi:hypothetical protein